MARLPVEIRSAFFDRGKIVRAFDRAERRVLSTMGFRVRQTARKSLKPVPKRRKRNPRTGQLVVVAKAAAPGQPPYAHTRDGLRLIFFTYDKVKGSVVVGPIKFGSRGGSRTVPNIQEFGGVAPRGRYPARPFMGPALEKNQDYAVNLWAGALTL